MDLLTRPKTSHCTSSARWNPLQSISQSLKTALSVTEVQKRRFSTEGEWDCLLFFQPSLISLLFSLSEWYFLDLTKIPVGRFVSMEGFSNQMCVSVVQGSGDIWRMSTQAALCGGYCAKSTRVSLLATLQKSCESPLPLSVCNSKLGKALFSSF